MTHSEIRGVIQRPGLTKPVYHGASPLDGVLRAADGSSALARTLGLSISAVTHWRQAGCVPPKWRKAVAEAAGMPEDRVPVSAISRVPKLLDAQIRAAGGINKFAMLIQVTPRTVKKWRAGGLSECARAKLVHAGVLTEIECVQPLAAFDPSEPRPAAAVKKRCIKCRTNEFLTCRPTHDWVCEACRASREWRDGADGEECLSLYPGSTGRLSQQAL